MTTKTPHYHSKTNVSAKCQNISTIETKTNILFPWEVNWLRFIFILGSFWHYLLFSLLTLLYKTFIEVSFFAFWQYLHLSRTSHTPPKMTRINRRFGVSEMFTMKKTRNCRTKINCDFTSAIFCLIDCFVLLLLIFKVRFFEVRHRISNLNLSI